MSHLLDTCLLSEIIKPQPNQGVKDFLAQISHNEDSDLYISVFSMGEIKRGINRIPVSKRKSELQQWYENILHIYKDKFLSFDLEVSNVWAEITGYTESKGKTLSSIDSLIAATAIYYELTVITRNVSDFEHTGARILNPWT